MIKVQIIYKYRDNHQNKRSAGEIERERTARRGSDFDIGTPHIFKYYNRKPETK